MSLGVNSNGTTVASFNMNSDDLENFMRQKWVMTSSDGTNGHPRKFASFPRKYADFVKQRRIMPLQNFIHQSSGLVADTFGIKDRGYIKAGHFADIVVVDPDTFAPQADFQQWNVLSTGVVHAYVNGIAAIEHGNYTGAKAGIALRRADSTTE